MFIIFSKNFIQLCKNLFYTKSQQEDEGEANNICFNTKGCVLTGVNGPNCSGVINIGIDSIQPCQEVWNNIVNGTKTIDQDDPIRVGSSSTNSDG